MIRVDGKEEIIFDFYEEYDKYFLELTYYRSDTENNNLEDKPQVFDTQKYDSYNMDKNERPRLTNDKSKVYY